MIDKLKIALQDMQVANELLKSAKGSFVKRIISRAIAMRMHNMVVDKIFYQTNNTSNITNIPLRKIIRGELKALEEFYKNYLEQQRHKFGGHFQHMKLGERIDLWSQLDFTTVNFFYEMTADLYSKFSHTSDYESITSLFNGFTATEISTIEKICKQHDDTSVAMIATDVLSFSRPNTGGILHGTIMQNQCASLNALELLIAFEDDLFEAFKTNKKVADLIKKVLIIDIVNYADNFFTRTDVVPGDLQYYEGLDLIIPPEFKEAHKVINDFKNIYKLQEKINKFRNVRDKTCSHIDYGSTVTDLQTLLDDTNFDELIDFYNTLSALLNNVYKSHIIFSLYRVKNTALEEGTSIVGIDTKSFDKTEAHVTSKAVVRVDPNDKVRLLEALKEISVNQADKNDKDFIWAAMDRSTVIKKERDEIEFSPGSKRYHEFEFRTAHKFIIDLLNDPNINQKLKIGTIICISSFGISLAIKNILLESYAVNSVNPLLERCYFIALGNQINEYDQKVIHLLKNPNNRNDFWVLYHSLLALFKMDVSERRGHYVNQYNTEENLHSRYIKDTIIGIMDPLHRLAICAGLASELVTDQRLSYSWKKTKEVYHAAFSEEYMKAIKEFLTIFRAPVLTPDQLKELVELFNCDFHIASLSILSEHFRAHKLTTPEQLVYSLLLTHLVKINSHHLHSVYNYSLILYYAGEKKKSVQLLESILATNPNDVEFILTYLTFLNEIDKDKFEKEKQRILSNYRLSQDFIDAIYKI